MGLRIKGLLFAGFLLVLRGESLAAPLIDSCVSLSGAERRETLECPGTPDWMDLFVSGYIGSILVTNHYADEPPASLVASLVELSAGSISGFDTPSDPDSRSAFVDDAISLNENENGVGANFLIPVAPVAESDSWGGETGVAGIPGLANDLVAPGWVAFASLCIGALGVTVGLRRRLKHDYHERPMH